jgi:hypothetical protein
MEMYKEASKIGLRFQTTQGSLTVEQLWSLSLSKLSLAVKALKKQMKGDDDDELSFLDETKVVDREKQLQFEILKDIYITKKQEADAEKNAVAMKEHNQYILSLIKTKQDQELANKSIDELKAMLKA